MVVHDAPGPNLDAAEGGHGFDPSHDPFLDLVGLEQHRLVRDARGDVIDAVIDGHAVLSCHGHSLSFRSDGLSAGTEALWQKERKEALRKPYENLTIS